MGTIRATQAVSYLGHPGLPGRGLLQVGQPGSVLALSLVSQALRSPEKDV